MRYLESFNSDKDDVISMIIDNIEEESFLKYDTILSIIKQKEEYLDEVISFYNANMSNIEIENREVDEYFFKNFVKYPIKYDEVKQNLYYLSFKTTGDIHDDLDGIIKFKSFIKKKFSIISEGRNYLFIYLFRISTTY